ncbi:MAG: hypothetical protein ACJAVX_004118 [Pseudoalteromonas rhizosphaerae]|jgi:hypothetical protein|tara:strand:+ start:178 stop:423 length:246 start_codon:yes stop_codon:yes gene_type:complete
MPNRSRVSVNEKIYPSLISKAQRTLNLFVNKSLKSFAAKAGSYANSNIDAKPVGASLPRAIFHLYKQKHRVQIERGVFFKA